MAQQKGDKQGQGNWEQDLEDLGRAVGSEVRSLVNELGRTLGPAVRDVSAGVGEGLRGAAQGLGQAAQEFSKAARQLSLIHISPGRRPGVFASWGRKTGPFDGAYRKSSRKMI